MMIRTFNNIDIRIFETADKTITYAPYDIAKVLNIHHVDKKINKIDSEQIVQFSDYDSNGIHRPIITIPDYIIFKWLKKVKNETLSRDFKKWIIANRRIFIEKQVLVDYEASMTEKDDQIEELIEKNKELEKGYKPVIKYSNIDPNEYTDDSVVYLIHVANDYFKFGVSHGIDRRYNEHCAYFRKLKYDPKLVNIWVCKTGKIMQTIEKKIKLYAQHNKILVKHFGQTEILKTDDINHIVNKITQYVDKYNNINAEISSLRAKELDLKIKEAAIKEKELDLRILEITKSNELEILKYQHEIKCKEIELIKLNTNKVNNKPANTLIVIKDDDVIDEDANKKNSKEIAAEWIKNNPPNSGELTTDYYNRYTNNNENIIHSNNFGPLVKSIIKRGPVHGTNNRHW